MAILQKNVATAQRNCDTPMTALQKANNGRAAAFTQGAQSKLENAEKSAADDIKNAGSRVRDCDDKMSCGFRNAEKSIQDAQNKVNIHRVQS
ncbi:hypothetical protein L226DRAFT_574344 [Lentinus tigrinus ALCF2SS1-7]|uniref:Uncharacterized protein n=1 Tax=Lentinus tigrinus ALCF2SS1-6 TaxID=1328759 RepID=A0A5C2SAQ9_9APHY|nr:hypothetical protein L227DRAFT_611306 [Lentinus tigrinus ALCF2SS1-6]RPD70888.1 hypothetical protein L226DRAFT_574344 [Lentinus tigrinus ALCF2SS1-7]